MTKINQTILVICGPTASGKTSLALSIAKELVGAIHESPVSTPIVNILSVDSRQIYQDLDILTGKDIPTELPPSIKVFGLNLIKADQVMNLADFVRYAHKVISNSIKENIRLIIVGGTGLYLKAVTSNLLDVNVPPNEKLRTKLEKLNTEELKKILLQSNPAKYHSLNNSDINNPRRLIRAIEIAKFKKPNRRGFIHETRNIDYHFSFLGLRPDKETQIKNIRDRVLDRLKNGALDEVKTLLKKYPNKNFPIFTSLGVSPIIDFLEKKISREELVNQWASAEIDYARRQMVWFKKQPEIIWYDKDNQPLATELTKIF